MLMARSNVHRVLTRGACPPQQSPCLLTWSPSLLMNGSSVTPSSTDPFMSRVCTDGHRTRWLDSLRIHVRGGRGGHGLAERGGQGGKGGDVTIAVEETRGRRRRQTTNLFDVLTENFPKPDPEGRRVRGSRTLKAGHGGDATRYRLLGQQGKDVVVKVPRGVQVVDDNDRVLASLDQLHDRLVVARGGMGGHRDNGWGGEIGERRAIRLDLRLLADCGLIGFPNAGKSTLLKALSKARPKIANYPFTTLKPNIGHILFEDGRRISVADLPGLIEGAHYDIGMGHTFLKHVERTSLLVFVIDVNGFSLNPHVDVRSAFETIVLLNRELELYNEDLLSKPALCIVNKMDSADAETKLDDVLLKLEDYDLENVFEDKRLVPQRKLVFDEVIPISAKFSSKTTSYVKNAIRKWMDHHEMRSNNWDHSEEASRVEMVQANRELGPVLV